MDRSEISVLKYKLVEPDEYKEVLTLAANIWKQSFKDILPPERIDYLFDFMYGGDKVRKQIENGEQVYTLIFLDKEAIGYYSIQRLSNEEYKLNKLYLSHEHQGKGYAWKIMDRIKNEIDSNNASSLILTVNRGNARAIRFYKKYGFEITGEEDFDVGGGHVMDDYIMELKLK